MEKFVQTIQNEIIESNSLESNLNLTTKPV